MKAPSPTLRELEREIQRLQRENERLREENKQLREDLLQALRAAKRPGAPHSRGTRKENPQKPGRKAGCAHGPAQRRPIPPRIDETLEAELPRDCPGCGGPVEESHVAAHYETEIPEPQIQHLCFRVHVGYCQECGRRVQGRHPRQTSDALGAAAVSLGPRAVALSAHLNKGLGLSQEKTAAVLEQAFGLRVTRSGIYQAIARLAGKAEPTYQGLLEGIRRARSVTPDETGWRVGGESWWLWAFASAELIVYSIQRGRGFDEAARILGVDFAGFLVRDGWVAYLRFLQALQQTCLAHLLRRCREMLTVASPGTAWLALTGKEILQQALRLRDRREAGQLSAHGGAVARGLLEARMDRLLERRSHWAANERLANHLYRERDYLFTFLYYPGLEATNWRAEQALRPAVVARKVWGGNRTPAGAHVQEILLSVLRTCQQQKRSARDLFMEMLCRRESKSWDLVPADRSPPAPSDSPYHHPSNCRATSGSGSPIAETR